MSSNTIHTLILITPSLTGAADSLLGASSLDTTSASISSEADATLKAGKQIAGTLLETLEKKLGASVVIGIYAEVQRRLQATRAEKKRVLASEAVSNPRAHAQRKAEKALRKKESRKRKSTKGTACSHPTPSHKPTHSISQISSTIPSNAPFLLPYPIIQPLPTPLQALLVVVVSKNAKVQLEMPSSMGRWNRCISLVEVS